MSTTFATSRPTSVLPGETLQVELCHQKAIKQPKRICRPVNWASWSFLHGPKPTIDESLLNKTDAIDADIEILRNDVESS